MLLHVENLTVEVRGSARKPLVDGIQFDIPEQRIVALVGGSGSGKTTTGLSILKLLDPALRIRSGKMIFAGNDLAPLPERAMQKVRGKDIGMAFQEPLHAFNPVFTVGYQIEEVLRYHLNMTEKEIRLRILTLLDLVGISEPQRVARSYPHQLSGGMRQRAMVAQAIAAHPKLLIADEPTSNLDVTLQAKVIKLFQNLKDQLKLSILLITHDLGLVQYLSDEVYVMSEGRIVEQGAAQNIARNPQHPYTQRLWEVLKE